MIPNWPHTKRLQPRDTKLSDPLERAGAVTNINNKHNYMKNKTSKETPGKMKTLTLAYVSPAKHIDPQGLTINRNFIEHDVPFDQPVDESKLNRLIAKMGKKFQSPKWKFVVIPERYRNLDAPVIAEYLSGLENELPPANWNIPQE